YSIKKAYKQVINSISFYPFIIAFSLLALSWGVVYLDNIKVGKAIINKVSFLRIDNPNTARSLLSSLLTGLISLVTFTFSMVMIVLTQVMSSFSPRLLPNLVSKKGNQVVLGIIMGTICFTTIVLSNVQTMPTGQKVPVFSVVISMFLGFVSLFCFIYFIHKISNEIQIGNILNDIYRTTRDVLNRESDSNCYVENWAENETSVLVKAWDSGHFDTITEKVFIRKSKKMGLKLSILKNQGMYVLKGDSFLKINQPLTAAIKNLLEENVLLRHQELIRDNYFYGFKHLTEIAVKALSPGINDPGTAIQAIDYLMDLFSRLQTLRGQKIIRHKDGTPCIIYAPVPFEETFYLCLASIRPYSSEDVTVQSRLITLISKISEQDEEDLHKSLFEKELNSIEEASMQVMKSQEDMQFIKALLQKARAENLTKR
ncbi:MAG: hypothetical protein COW65_07290, partial [Cytophagales bacterium CG18_big_fil_WC_8_21_14_2_50_42_9]